MQIYVYVPSGKFSTYRVKAWAPWQPFIIAPPTILAWINDSVNYKERDEITCCVIFFIGRFASSKDLHFFIWEVSAFKHNIWVIDHHCWRYRTLWNKIYTYVVRYDEIIPQSNPPILSIIFRSVIDGRNKWCSPTLLTRRGRKTHICVLKLDHNWSPVRQQFARTYCRSCYLETHTMLNNHSLVLGSAGTLKIHGYENRKNVWCIKCTGFKPRRPCGIFYKHPHALASGDALRIGLKYSEIYFRTQLLHNVLTCHSCLRYN